MRGPIININVNNLIDNYQVLKQKYQRPIMAVVKDNAYGHGACLIAKALCQNGVNFLAVASIYEAQELRESKITSDILVFGKLTASDYLLASKLNLVISINCLDELKTYVATKTNLPFHLKLNTGMNRLGLDLQDLDQAISIIRREKLNIQGIYTHFATKDNNLESTNLFAQMLKRLDLTECLIHTGESNCLLGQVNMVRIGINLYGLTEDSRLKQVLTISAPIVLKRPVKSGEFVSYGQISQTPSAGYIYVLDFGYGHGWLSFIDLKLPVDQVMTPICMDYTIVFSINDYPKTYLYPLLTADYKIWQYSKDNQISPYLITTLLKKELYRS